MSDFAAFRYFNAFDIYASGVNVYTSCILPVMGIFAFINCLLQIVFFWCIPTIEGLLSIQEIFWLNIM